MHIGVGGFHRSHEAYYTDALMNEAGPPRVGHLRGGFARGRPQNGRHSEQAGLPVHPDR